MQKASWFAVLVLITTGLAFGGTITVSQPAGGSFAMGAACPVHWTATGISGNVKIQLIRPGGGLVGLLIGRLDPGSSPYPWVVASPAEAGQAYRIRVSTVDGSAIGESAEFTVTAAADPVDPGPPPGTIANVRLGGASPHTIGNSVTVSWTASGVSQNLKLQLIRSSGGLVGAIVNSLAAGTISYSWTAGQYIGGTAGAGEYKIRVSTVDNALTAESPAFSLAAAGAPGTPGSSITVTEPSAATSWRPGSRQTITWTKSGDMPVMVQLTLRREGAPETEDPIVRIADGCANNGSRVWFIPDDLAEGRYFVRVRASSSVRGDSAVFAIDAEGARSGLAGPDTPIRADLEMPGVGVEYDNGNIVAWVKNNGPDSLRDHDVKFLLNFPERGGGGHYITRRITVPVGAQQGVSLQTLAAGDIPDAGLRTSVSIETSRSNISDANRLNQHRDVRIFKPGPSPLDLSIAIRPGSQRVTHVLLSSGKAFYRKYRLYATLLLRSNSPHLPEIRRVPCRWELQFNPLGTSDWLYYSHYPSGTIQLGPFRNGEENAQDIVIDFLIRDYKSPEQRRIFFTLDPDRIYNDTNRGNNITFSISFDA